MALPSYKDNQAPSQRPSGCNAGLWFERFFDRFDEKWNVGDQKGDWLKNNFNSDAGDGEQLKTMAMQQLQLARDIHGVGEVFTTQWHFVTGTGNPHPVENGLSWHPTLGVPYLTGAAVKGLVRNYLEVWEKEDNDENQGRKLISWFGSKDKNPIAKNHDPATGGLIFFDALPIGPVTMNVDIMTPHMGKWYEQGGEIKDTQEEYEKVPADWHDPIPIPFLAIKKAHFLFTIAPRNKQCNIPMDEVMEVLKKSLDILGAGAKTAVGYGQMMIDKTQNKQLYDAIKNQKDKANLQSMSKEQQEIINLKQLFEKDQVISNNAAGSLTSQKLNTLVKQADTWRQEDKNQLVELGEKIYTFIGWGNKKKKRKRKEAFAQLRGEK